MLTASGGTSYIWSTGETTTSISVNPTITATYSVTMADGNGCTNSSTVQVAVDQCTGIQTSSADALILITPNPSNGIFTVSQMGVNNISKVEIINMLGAKVYSANINADKAEINISKYPDGIYFLRLETNKGIFGRKIILGK